MTELSEMDVVTLALQAKGELDRLVLSAERLRAAALPLIDDREALFNDAEAWRKEKPIDQVLYCPNCSKQHLDIGEFRDRVHRKHQCSDTPSSGWTGCSLRAPSSSRTSCRGE